MKRIYESKTGDALINEQNFNEFISLFLSKERELIISEMTNYKAVIEVGCMNGRLLKLSVEYNKEYLGIDNSDKYIKEGLAIHKEFIKKNKCNLIKGNAEELNQINQFKSFKDGGALAIFPFNSFGNIDDTMKAIISLSNSGVKFLIFTYQDDFKSISARDKYYKSSGFKDVTFQRSDKGVLFSSSQGLNSWSFSSDWFKTRFKEQNTKLYSKLFGNIGVMFSNYYIK